MGKRHPSKLWLLAAVTACITAVAVLLCGWLSMRISNEANEQRLSLYWSSYSAQFNEMHDGWEGLDKQLEIDGPQYPETESIEVAVIDEKGQLIARYGDGGGEHQALSPSSSAGQQSKTIVVKGQIAGRVVTVMQEKYWPDKTVWLFTLTAALVVFVMVYGLLYLRSIRMNRSLEVLAKQAQQMLARRQDDLPDWSVRFMKNNESLKAISESLTAAQVHIDRLETVRRTMVADVAHELRTPLAIIRTTLDNALFTESSLPPSKLTALHAETMRISKLVLDLQELALAESGHLLLEKKWFSLSDLALSIVDTIAVDAEDKGVSVQCQSDLDIRIHADQNRIRQLIVNLLGNAIRHARTKVVLEVGLQPEGAFLTIGDDGFGIEEEDFPHLFDRFYRAKSGLALHDQAAFAGLGLGLAIVKQYAQTHGGRVTAESKWGEGAVFTVVLPLMSEGQSA